MSVCSHVSGCRSHRLPREFPKTLGAQPREWFLSWVPRATGEAEPQASPQARGLQAGMRVGSAAAVFKSFIWKSFRTSELQAQQWCIGPGEPAPLVLL